MSQSDLAEIAGIEGAKGATRQSQALYEKGERMPDAAYLAAIAKAGIDVKYVITGSRGFSPPPIPALLDEEKVLVQVYRDAPTALRRAALRVLNESGPVLGSGGIGIGGSVTGQVVDGDLVNQGSVTIGTSEGKKR